MQMNVLFFLIGALFMLAAILAAVLFIIARQHTSSFSMPALNAGGKMSHSNSNANNRCEIKGFRRVD